MSHPKAKSAHLLQKESRQYKTLVRNDAFSSRTLENKLREDISLFSFLAATARSHMLMLGCHINPDFNPAFEEYTKKMAQLFRAMDGAK